MEGETLQAVNGHEKHLSRDAVKERHFPIILDDKKDKDLSVAERVSMNIAKLLEEQEASRKHVSGEVASLLRPHDDVRIHHPACAISSSSTAAPPMILSSSTPPPAPVTLSSSIGTTPPHVALVRTTMEPDRIKEKPTSTPTHASRTHRKRSVEKDRSIAPSIIMEVVTRSKRAKLTKTQTPATVLPMMRRSSRVVNALSLKKKSTNQEVNIKAMKEREINDRHKQKRVSKDTMQSQVREKTPKKESAGKTKERATKERKVQDNNSMEKATSKQQRELVCRQKMQTEEEAHPNDESTNVEINLYKHLPNLRLQKHRESQIRWIGMFEDLKKYIIKHGHLEVPCSHGALGSFVHNQRQVFRKERLLAEKESRPTVWVQTIEDRFAALRSIGYRFESDYNQRRWDQKIHELIEYKKENGHLEIPQRHNKLGQWTSQQRKNYAHGCSYLTKERINQLAKLGFMLTANKDGPLDSHWNNMFRQLIEYKKINGHTNAPRYTPIIGSWVRAQKGKMRAFKAGKPAGTPYHSLRALSPKQIDALNEIGFTC